MFSDIQSIQDVLQLAAQNPSNPLLEERHHLFSTLPQLRPAAVLVGFVPDYQGKWQILLTKRAEHLRHHSGQIAFAGGKCDNNETPFQTALREAHEEIGTPPYIWQPFNLLPQLHTPSAYCITPVSAFCTTTPNLLLNPTEVAESFYLPIHIAFNPKLYAFSPAYWQNQTFFSPTLQHQHHFIWSATALILYHLAQCASLLETQTH